MTKNECQCAAALFLYSMAQGTKKPEGIALSG